MTAVQAEPISPKINCPPLPHRGPRVRPTRPREALPPPSQLRSRATAFAIGCVAEQGGLQYRQYEVQQPAAEDSGEDRDSRACVGLFGQASSAVKPTIEAAPITHPTGPRETAPARTTKPKHTAKTVVTKA